MPGPAHNGAESVMLSIGALSNVTGIPVETIRSWERRYGFPIAERKPSGHRRYPLSTVTRVRRIAQAIAAGYRPADVVPASEKALDALLAAIPPDIQAASSSRSSQLPVIGPSTEEELAQQLNAVNDFDAARLQRAFGTDWARLGPVDFLEHRVAPLLRRIGDAWSSGALDVRHEHFASACLGDFLRTVRAPLDDRASGPTIALATLPGERHGLGLQMAAVVLATAGWRPLMIGVDVPVQELVSLVKDTAVAAVGISMVRQRRRGAGDVLASLRRRLRRHIPLIVGGAEAPSTPRRQGITVLGDLPALETWAKARVAG